MTSVLHTCKLGYLYHCRPTHVDSGWSNYKIHDRKMCYRSTNDTHYTKLMMLFYLQRYRAWEMLHPSINHLYRGSRELYRSQRRITRACFTAGGIVTRPSLTSWRSKLETSYKLSRRHMRNPAGWQPCSMVKSGLYQRITSNQPMQQHNQPDNLLNTIYM